MIDYKTDIECAGGVVQHEASEKEKKEEAVGTLGIRPPRRDAGGRKWRR